MIDFNLPSTYEHIRFYNNDFPFGIYTICGLVTLPHWHNHMEFIYAKKGDVDIYINGTLYKCNEGDVLIVPKNSLHSIIPKEKSVYVAVVIGDNLLDQLKSDLHFSKVLNIYHKINFGIPFYFSEDVKLYDEVVNLINEMVEEDKRKDSHYKVFIKLSLCRFFTMLHRSMPEIFGARENEQINQTIYIKSSIEYLTENYAEKITIKHMCGRVNLSEQHFSRLFKLYTGKTFVEYLTLFRLEQAEKLLIQTNIPITQIPELIGFCNANYFSRVYKMYYKKLPSTTRKNRIANK